MKWSSLSFQVGNTGTFYFLLLFLLFILWEISWGSGLFSVTSSPWFLGNIPMGRYGGWWGSESLKFLCCPYSQLWSWAPQQPWLSPLGLAGNDGCGYAERGSRYVCFFVLWIMATARSQLITPPLSVCICHSGTAFLVFRTVNILLFSSTLLLFFPGACC